MIDLAEDDGTNLSAQCANLDGSHAFCSEAYLGGGICECPCHEKHFGWEDDEKEKALI